MTAIAPGVKVERPAYSGKAVESISVSGDAVITIRPNAIESAESGGSADISTVDSGENLRIAIIEAIAKAGERLDVSEADIIISGGRGLGDRSNFEKLESVADSLGAAVGASRAVVDEWGTSAQHASWANGKNRNSIPLHRSWNIRCDSASSWNAIKQIHSRHKQRP